MPTGDKTTRMSTVHAQGQVPRAGSRQTERLTPEGTAPWGAFRSMPESLAAEAAVLGSMIIDPACIGQVIELLRRESFYRIEHQILFDALLHLYQNHRSEAIDGILLRDELERRKQTEAVGGVEYLTKVVESVPSSANVMYYATIVADKALLRELIAASTEALQQAYDQASEVTEILDQAEQRIFAVTEKKVSTSAASVKDLVMEAFELIEKREGAPMTGLPTGYHELDDRTCGFQPGEMIIIAGRPSMGKTSLALNIAEHMGVVEKIPLAIFSLEMSKHVLAERFLCTVGRVDAQMVRKGMITEELRLKLHDAGNQLYDAPIYIDDCSALSPLELRAKARRLKNLYGIQALFVDYLQLMHLGLGSIESRQQEISTISRYLKGLARELNVPVVVLSQLNRSPEGREGHRPRMSDLRESGSIEQDADVVILLHREDYYTRGEKEHQDTNTAELIIAKQRNGPTGTVELRFFEKYTRFDNPAPGYVSEQSESF